jgi:glycosyltransferase involved in cell wall biosynthesis
MLRLHFRKVRPLAAPSVFSGLSLSRASGVIEISYPNRVHDSGRATEIGRAHGVEIRPAGESWIARHAAGAVEYPRALKNFFAALNDTRPPYPELDSAALRAGEPIVSCIIVVNENLPFVREQLLPSLAANSKKFPIEIVIVCNGAAGWTADTPGLKAVRSEWGAVSKAYNAGAKASRGKLLAFFHDDCIVRDELWIEKCVQRLDRGAHIVAAEYRIIDKVADVVMPELPIAKCVPLVIRRSDFDALGGYDEYHYIGYEDFDFTLAAASRGMKLVATDLQVDHYHGMSSTLKYSPVQGLADLYALTALPRVAVMQRFREFWNGGLYGVEHMQLAMQAQLLYVLRKYRVFLSGIDKSAYALAQTALEREIADSGFSGPDIVLERFREIDRGGPAARRAAR